MEFLFIGPGPSFILFRIKTLTRLSKKLQKLPCLPLTMHMVGYFSDSIVRLWTSTISSLTVSAMKLQRLTTTSPTPLPSKFTPALPPKAIEYVFYYSKRSLQMWEVLCSIIPNFRGHMLALSGDRKMRKAVCGQVNVFISIRSIQLILFRILD